MIARGHIVGRLGVSREDTDDDALTGRGVDHHLWPRATQESEDILCATMLPNRSISTAIAPSPCACASPWPSPGP